LALTATRYFLSLSHTPFPKHTLPSLPRARSFSVSGDVLCTRRVRIVIYSTASLNEASLIKVTIFQVRKCATCEPGWTSRSLMYENEGTHMQVMTPPDLWILEHSNLQMDQWPDLIDRYLSANQSPRKRHTLSLRVLTGICSTKRFAHSYARSPAYS